MPRFFITPQSIQDGRVIIDGGLYHHAVRVRRAAAGDIIELAASDGTLFRARITDIGLESATAEIIDKIDIRFSNVNITMGVALLKGKKFDLVIQKAVETGVSTIIPMVTERSIPRLADDADNRSGRWRRIANEAAQQSLRKSPPVVDPVRSIDSVLGDFNNHTRIVAHADPGARRFKDYARSRPAPGDAIRECVILIGPEGGFSDREIDSARDSGWEILGFGDTQLRSETAAIVLPAILIYEWS